MKKFIFVIFLFSSLNAQVLINNLQLRAAENRIYNILESIKVINYYINTFILNSATIPTRSNLVARYGMQSNLTTVTWPRAFDNNTKLVNFNVDVNSFQVTFNNIFVNIPTNSIKEIFKNHPSLPQGSIVNYDLSITIPLDSSTMKFQNEINYLVSNSTTIATNLNCGGVVANATWYQPNGLGAFRLRYCDGNKAIDLPALKVFRFLKSSVGQIGEKVFNSAGEELIFTTTEKADRIKK